MKRIGLFLGIKGGAKVIEICFEEENEAVHVYKALKNRTAYKYEEISVYLHETTVVVHMPVYGTQYMEKVLIPVLVQFIINKKQNEWCLSILQDTFFYEEREEQNQILHMAHSILNEKREGLKGNLSFKAAEELVIVSLKGWLSDPLSFSFSSYTKFRLRKYRQFLYRLMELAIDEYKMEQEYQMFIEALRQKVSGRKPRLSSLHLVFQDSFIFYNEKGIRLKEEQLVYYIDKDAFPDKDMYIDTNVIAPLLSIAPEAIHIYTKEQDHNMIVTIQNVFEERVKVHRLDEFEVSMKSLKNKRNALDFLGF